jgi:hypothetical protein
MLVNEECQLQGLCIALSYFVSIIRSLSVHLLSSYLSIPTYKRCKHSPGSRINESGEAPGESNDHSIKYILGSCSGDR